MRALGKAILKAIKGLAARLDSAIENEMEKIMSSCRSHEAEIFANKNPLSREIYERTKNVMVWKDAPAAIPDWRATEAARKAIETQVRKEFAAKAQEENRGKS